MRGIVKCVANANDGGSCIYIYLSWFAPFVSYNSLVVKSQHTKIYFFTQITDLHRLIKMVQNVERYFAFLFSFSQMPCEWHHALRKTKRETVAHDKWFMSFGLFVWFYYVNWSGWAIAALLFATKLVFYFFFFFYYATFNIEITTSSSISTSTS